MSAKILSAELLDKLARVYRTDLAINRIQRRLDPDNNDGDFNSDYVPWRPRGMRRHTYRRLVGRLAQLQEAREDIWTVRLFGFMRRWGAAPEEVL